MFERLRFPVLVSLLLLLLGVLHGRQLASRALSNLSAFALPNIQDVGVLTDRDDKWKEIRATALILDPNNVSAQTQEFRWLRATGQLYKAARWIPIADRFQFFMAWPDTAWFFAEYAWDKAKAYAEAGQLAEAVKHYFLALFRSPQSPDPERLARFYRTLAQFTLSDGEPPGPECHRKAGNLFALAGEPDLALEQAHQIDIHSEVVSENAAAVSWASWILAQAAHQRGDTREAIALLQVSINAGKSPEAAALLLELAQMANHAAAANAARNHLSGLNPDWELASTEDECVNDGWELAGFDLDEDVLEAGLELVADLYWLPQCNRSAQEYGLIETGRYWIQPQYLAPNGFINAGFEWELPGEETTVCESPPRCCDVVVYDTNRVLHVTRPAQRGTSAVGQPVPRYLSDAPMYVIGGRFHWGLNTDAEFAYAILGGFWLDEHDVHVSGPYSVGDSCLQEFVVLPLESSGAGNLTEWLKLARIVRPPAEAIKFSPWIGLSTDWRTPPEGVRMGGAVDTYFDSLFLFPVRTLED